MKNEGSPIESAKDSEAEGADEIKIDIIEPKAATESDNDLELDVTSEQFNPLRALYAPDYKITSKKPKVLYQNLDAFECALKKFGIFKLNTLQNTKPKQTKHADASHSTDNTTSATNVYFDEDSETKRRFLPHQMAVECHDLTKQRHNRNLIAQMTTEVEGPLARLYKCIQQHERVLVSVRSEHGIRGSIEGNLIFFDKHWNLLLNTVTEVWRRRKFIYGENKFCGVAENCDRQLRDLGIVLPTQKVKSLNRKNVEIKRNLEQLLVRGEQVVKVIILSATKKVSQCQLK